MGCYADMAASSPPRRRTAEIQAFPDLESGSALLEFRAQRSDCEIVMPRILIADDSAGSRRALRGLIQGNGWEVCGEAEDGLSAVEKAAILKPDLVILDFRMPNLNGLEAGRVIHAADPSLPLLLFTLYPVGSPLLELTRGAGFRGALAKGEGIFALSEAIEVLLRGKTFFLSASESRLSDSTDATEDTTKGLNVKRNPTT
jgi:DNA-binding NarL/FixJ family response regulator